VPEVQNVSDVSDQGAALVISPAPGQPAPDAAPDELTTRGQVLLAPPPLAAPPLAAPLVAPPALTAVQLALYTGWTMALLYGHIQAPPAAGELPTPHELPPPDRRDLELSRLGHLLQHLSSLPGIGAAEFAAAIPVSFAAANPPVDAAAAFRASLQSLNLTILKSLTTAPPEIEMAYQLGRSLRDTVNPPLENAAQEESRAPAVARQLGRQRVAKLQEWLATLSAGLPPHAAAVVATSLGRWSELAAATVGTSSTRLRKASAHAVATTMCEYLLPQGDLWLMLLTGVRSGSGLLSPEAYVAAGEVAMRRSAAIVRGILRHYWFAAVILGAALAGILVLVVSTLTGGAEVWTCIAAVSGSLGFSFSAIAATSARLAAEAEQPVFAMAEEDAMAWAITAMPAVSLSYLGVRQLRRSGIAPSANLGRV
jgi:hypothetical protein